MRALAHNPARRRLILGLSALAAAAAVPNDAGAATFLDAVDSGLLPDTGSDQSAALQSAIGAAAAAGQVLLMPAGTFLVEGIELPPGASIRGVRGRTILQGNGGTVLRVSGQSTITLEDLTIGGLPNLGNGSALLDFTGCSLLRLADLALENGFGGVAMTGCSGAIADCTISAIADAGIFALDSAGLRIVGNAVSDCGNNGILVWRSEEGEDGTIVSENRVSDIRWDSGGNGQNGNGINVFRASGVIVSGNAFSRCAFSAVRVNASRNTQVSGNTCLQSGEVAIFSEFGFSGSVISGNIVDGAAQGISITNFDHGGRLAVCTGNLVRNIAARSEVNPDTRPVGIAAEADTIVADNVVEAVPGAGIAAGWGPYLRDVLVQGNIVREAAIGIAVSVAEGAGAAKVTGNLVSGASLAAIAGLAWTEIVSVDLEADSAQYPRLDIAGNTVAAA